MSKEKLALQVWATHDIAQHGKPIAIGPSSHEDEEANENGCTILVTFTNLVLKGIATESLPDAWSANLKALVYKEYGVIFRIHPNLVMDPGGRMADLAIAIKRGIGNCLPRTNQRSKDCYAHTWRAIFKRDNLNKLKNSSTEKVPCVCTNL